MFYSHGENRRKRWYHLLSIGQKKLLVLGSVLALALVAVLVVFITYSCRAMGYDLERVVQGSGTSTLYDCEHRPIASLNREEVLPVRWEELPRNLVNAFVAREDESFFEHGGVVYSSVLRSVLRNISSMSYEQGASTITMQLTRNVFELSGKTLNRKLLEALLAQRIERRFDKQTILTQYLNRIYFGQNCYGIAEAASRYFGKHVMELNLVECATLAGLVRAPSLCNPVTDMENAMGVKRETLARMLEMEFISQEEYDNAVAEPITLADESASVRAVPSYASMWATRELEEMREELGENAGGISVVANLDLDLQQRVEQSMERALVAVEKPNSFPDEWMPILNENPEEAQRLRKFYESIERPAGMKVRDGNDLERVLQCCVLVVDARRNNKGRVLAMVSGRSAVDGRDRWLDYCQPGNALSPLLYSCACLPGGDNTHIVAREAEVTGHSLGYDVVSSLYRKLGLDMQIPTRAEESALYRGEFRMRRIDLARILFDIQNQGRDYRFKLVSRVWSRGNKLLHVHAPEQAPEYIRRESATAVAEIPPFEVSDGQPVVLNETLPGRHGTMCMVFNNRGVAVFVWMGFDKTEDMPQSSRMSGLMKRAAYCLARELHSEARARLRARAAEEKKS